MNAVVVAEGDFGDTDAPFTRVRIESPSASNPCPPVGLAGKNSCHVVATIETAAETRVRGLDSLGADNWRASDTTK
jgi:hypothetical protein